MGRGRERGPRLRTLGIDLASRAANTAACRVDWDSGAVEVTAPADDPTLLALLREPGLEKVGIDTPLGWPDAFVEGLVAHRDGGGWAAFDDESSRHRSLYRRTDLEVRGLHGLQPLSVSADRIAYPSMRCSALLREVGIGDRSGAGLVAELYPEGSLRCWGLRARGAPTYKGAAAADRRRALIDALDERLPGGIPMPPEALRSDHVLDAVVCAITARAVARGETRPVPREHVDAARREGWIHLPG